jgi:hypothetical protein
VFQGAEQGTSLQLEGLECAERGWDGFFGPFGFACFLPVCVAFGAVLVTGASALWGRVRGAKGGAAPGSVRERLALSGGYLWLVLVFGAARRVLSALNCTSYGSSFGERYVVTALWVECDRGRGDYAAVFATAVVLGPLFVVGTAVLLGRTLLRGADGEGGSGPAAAVLGPFLEAPYREEVRWWEAVQTSRRLALAVLQAVLPFQSASLPVLVTVLLTSSLAVHAWCKPFKRRVDNVAESVSLSLLLGTYMVGLVLANAAFRVEDRRGTLVAAWAVVVLNGLFLAVLFAGLFTRYAVAGYRRGKKLLFEKHGWGGPEPLLEY